MVMGERITFKAGSAETGEALSAFETLTPPGGGSPPHIHTREDEAFYVVDGTFDVIIGTETIRATPGSFCYGPRGVPHYYVNVGTEPGKLLVIFFPGHRLEEFFIEMSELPQEGPPDIAAIEAIMHKHGVQLALPPNA